MPDITIPLRIPADKVVIAQTGFFRLHPIPETSEWIADPIAGATGLEKVAWVRESFRLWFHNEVRQGLQVVASEAVTPNDDLVVVD